MHLGTLNCECDQIMERILKKKYQKTRNAITNTKRRKHADLIHAWAEGAEIQFQKQDKSWEMLFTNIPNWGPHEEIYRIKPKPRLLGLGILFTHLIRISSTDCDISEQRLFQKWLGDWQEVEIEEND